MPVFEPVRAERAGAGEAVRTLRPLHSRQRGAPFGVCRDCRERRWPYVASGADRTPDRAGLSAPIRCRSAGPGIRIQSHLRNTGGLCQGSANRQDDDRRHPRPAAPGRLLYRQRASYHEAAVAVRLAGYSYAGLPNPGRFEEHGNDQRAGGQRLAEGRPQLAVHAPGAAGVRPELALAGRRELPCLRRGLHGTAV